MRTGSGSPRGARPQPSPFGAQRNIRVATFKHRTRLLALPRSAAAPGGLTTSRRRRDARDCTVTDIATDGSRGGGPRPAPGLSSGAGAPGAIRMHEVHTPSTVAILLPALNEESGIGLVLDELPLETLKSAGYVPRVVLVDGHSTDATTQIARSRGAEIIAQTGTGKGWAVRTGLEQIESDYLVMLDADFTYPGDSIPALLGSLDEGADIVVGSRLRGSIEDGAMPPMNVLGNRFLSFLASTLYGHRISDVCSGMWAFGPNARAALKLNSGGFEVEAEIFAQVIKAGLCVREVPIRYRKRMGTQKLGSLSGGVSIASKLIRKRFTR